MALPITDITHLRDAEQAKHLQAVYQRECRLPFDCANPPLIRAALLTLAPEAHLLYIFVDHLVSDAWTMRVLKKDLLRFYEHYLQPEPPAIEPTEFSYPDYALWQREKIGEGYFDADAAYWRAQWAEYGDARIAPSDLPFAKQPANPVNGPVTSFAAARSSLSRDLSAQLVRLARDARVTLNNLLVAGYAIVLHRYTAKNKLALIGHFANRSRPETLDVAGWFTHTHLIGIDILPDMSFGELVACTRQRLMDGLAHEEMPAPLLWQMLRCAPRFVGAQPLLDIYADNGSPVTLTGEVSVESVCPPVVAGMRLSALGIYVRHEGEQFVLTSQTAPGLFTPDAPDAVIRDLAGVLEELVSGGLERRVSAIAVATRPRAADDVPPSDEMKEFVVSGGDRIPAL